MRKYHFGGIKNKTQGDRSFAVIAPSPFNALPRRLRHEKIFTHFKAFLIDFFVYISLRILNSFFDGFNILNFF